MTDGMNRIHYTNKFAVFSRFAEIKHLASLIYLFFCFALDGFFGGFVLN